jgi:hypothetical protein
MSGLSRVAVPIAVTAALLALAGCTVSPSAPAPTTTGIVAPDGTTGDEGEDGGGGGDPFEFGRDYPTDKIGWSARYTNIPWLADDLDNNDYLVTGSAEGHDVMGIYCNFGGEGGALLYSVDDNKATVTLQTPTDFDVLISRSQYLTFNGIGTYTLPTEERGTHPGSFSFSVAQEIDDSPGVYGKASPSTADLALDFLGVPFPDDGACNDEQDALEMWAYAQGGH